MGRLIDAERLKAHYCWWAGGSKEMSIDEAKKTFDTIIDVQPTVDIDAITESHEKIGFDKGYRDGYAQATVDAVEVVRCKECKHRVDDKMCEYKAYWVVPQDDKDYCSWGERREDDYEEPDINPCRGCEDYDGKGGCLSHGGCGERREDAETD